ncbi:TraR/DksA family transcriptional regulator [Onishia niordana]|uniref:TraR/DksA family transcriptional regulator n=1 Tax=Onishia niordana TaxID=2508711 RepID=UPI00109FCC4D|nr:TraR/DksA C4-type zinc finger protein [Halomonas niordiana]
MNHPQLNMDEVRQSLLEQRRKLLEEGEASADSRDTVTLDQTSTGRLTRMDALQTQAMAQAAQRRREATMRFIDLALTRIDDECFGECIECGEFISPKRLALNYATLKCIDCAE